MFFQREGKPFKQAHTIEILHQIPKFKPSKINNGWIEEIEVNNVDNNDDNKDCKPTPRSGGKYTVMARVMGNSIAQPVGLKKMKAKLSENSSITCANEGLGNLTTQLTGISNMMQAQASANKFQTVV